MPSDYKQYKEEITKDIIEVLKIAECQPILFVGSGFARRYAGAPNWEELLQKLAAACPLIDRDFAYYKQKHGSLPAIASIFSAVYQEWAWGAGRKEFPEICFSTDAPREIFIKHKAAELLRGLGPVKGSYGSPDLDSEIAALVEMGPHAVITTNYDQLLEPLFPQYEVVVGQQIFRKSFLVLGEIFKIHGCLSDPLSMVLTSEDYDSFNTDKRYLSAKLLTYFAEHPMLFVGYAAQDQNIKNVLYDISRMFHPEMALSPNIWILEWDPAQDDTSYPPRERVLEVGDGINVRIKSITASSFEWIYRAFGSNGSLAKVDLKALRSLMARTVHLIRTDIPTKNVEVNYQTLEHAVESGESFATLFGITSLDSPANVNAKYPYTPQMLGEKLGYKGWNNANKLISLVAEKTGFDMRESDNPYHFKLKTGKSANSFTRKYSDVALHLLQKVQTGDNYTLIPGYAAETGSSRRPLMRNEQSSVMSTSVIDPATIQAYRETHFCVDGETPMTLLVGQRNEALAALHEASGVESSAFVTAWNPYSQQCDDKTNGNRQNALADELIVLGLRFVQGVGRHPSSTWAEPSFLVLGISLEAAKELGTRYEENAIVWSGAGAEPKLVLLR